MPFPTFWDFVRRSSSNIKGVMAISKFDLLFDLVTQLFDLWPTKTICLCVVVDYICGPSLVMIAQKLRPVSRKMWRFHLNMNIEGPLWRHAVTSSVTSSTSKVLFLGYFRTVFRYLMSKWTYLKYFEIFKMAAILRSGRSFKPEVVPEIDSYTKIGHVIPYLLRFCSTF